MTQRRPLVLIADDDLDLRDVLQEVLVAAGCEVVAARDGVHFLFHLGWPYVPKGVRAPDVVICDHRMPGLLGLEVLRGLRAASWSGRFVLITAFGDPALHVEARRLGAAIVLDKPIDTSALTRHVLALAAAA